MNKVACRMSKSSQQLPDGTETYIYNLSSGNGSGNVSDGVTMAEVSK